MSREAKDQFIDTMRQDVAKAAGVVFLDYTGLTVAQADGFRRKLREANLTYKVVKNTLMSRALDDSGLGEAKKCLKGTPTGVVIAFEDPVTPAKITFDYLKDCENLKVKGGVVDNKAIGPKEVEALSKLPSRAELQGAIVSLALSPGRRIAGMIKHPAGRVAGAIEALVKKLGGGEG